MIWPSSDSGTCTLARGFGSAWSNYGLKDSTMSVLDALPYWQILAKMAAAGFAILITIEGLRGWYSKTADTPLDRLDKCVGFIIYILLMIFIGALIIL